MEPTKGRLTYEAEGNEGGRYHSRKLHVPSGSSGLTVGRGYDMRWRSANNVRLELMKAGVDRQTAEKLSKAAGLTGKRAEAFIRDNGLADFEISRETQRKLFEITYREQTKEAKRLCTKPDVTERYGTCDWDSLDPAMREVIVDLKYRGDYTPSARQHIQHAISDGDVEAFLELMSDRKLWPLVPRDRFRRRIEYLKRNATVSETQE